ncbi:hypothetical protein DFH27DRAFT_542676 [Peziza echinospora]|nr:hypothetical protein DFH27DRAFT_542676 [Peziza echinospora]
MITPNVTPKASHVPLQSWNRQTNTPIHGVAENNDEAPPPSYTETITQPHVVVNINAPVPSHMSSGSGSNSYQTAVPQQTASDASAPLLHQEHHPSHVHACTCCHHHQTEVVYACEHQHLQTHTVVSAGHNGRPAPLYYGYPMTPKMVTIFGKQFRHSRVGLVGAGVIIFIMGLIPFILYLTGTFKTPDTRVRSY